MIRLDKNQPYAEICGDPVAKYSQNDHDFDAQGRIIVPYIPAPEIAETEIKSPLSKLSIVQLKNILATHNQPYLSKQQAIEFLENIEAGQGG